MHGMNINDIITLLLAKEVDFETLHGLRPQGGTRVCIVAHFANRSIRINFGDRKHNHLVSTIHEAGQRSLDVKLDDLLAEIDSHTVVKDWRVNTEELRTQEFHVHHSVRKP